MRRRHATCTSHSSLALTLLAVFVAVAFAGIASVPPGLDVATRFLMARHGQTTFNAAKRFQGIMDKEPVLTEKGIVQARELGEWVTGIHRQDPLEAVFVSPLYRAQQTLDEVEGVVGDLPSATTLSDLREIELYEWQGKTQDEVKEADPVLFKLWKERTWEVKLGNGRPVVKDLWDRSASAWQQMRSQLAKEPEKRTALIVAHGTLGKAMLSTALGLPETAFRHFALTNGEVVEIAFPPLAAGAAAAAGAVWWRRRHPEAGPWRCLKDEQADIDAGVQKDLVTDAA